MLLTVPIRQVDPACCSRSRSGVLLTVPIRQPAGRSHPQSEETNPCIMMRLAPQHSTGAKAYRPNPRQRLGGSPASRPPYMGCRAGGFTLRLAPRPRNRGTPRRSASLAASAAYQRLYPLKRNTHNQLDPTRQPRPPHNHTGTIQPVEMQRNRTFRDVSPLSKLPVRRTAPVFIPMVLNSPPNQHSCWLSQQTEPPSSATITPQRRNNPISVNLAHIPPQLDNTGHHPIIDTRLRTSILLQTYTPSSYTRCNLEAPKSTSGIDRAMRPAPNPGQQIPIHQWCTDTERGNV